MNELTHDIIQNANIFYEEMKKNSFSSDYSWEFCYERFYEVLKGGNPLGLSNDDLALNLAFYLASWGMYRGSSFLTRLNYKVHTEAVEIISCYPDLIALDCDRYNAESAKRVEDIIKDLRKHYSEMRDIVPDKKDVSGKITDTLISKILIGTLGCVPAYDTYFVNAVRKSNVAVGVLNKKSVNQLFGFYKMNEQAFEDARKTMVIHGTDLQYPQMKLIDMGFWEIGFNNSKE